MSRDPDHRAWLRTEAEIHNDLDIRDGAWVIPDEGVLLDNVKGYSSKQEWRRIRERSMAAVKERVEYRGMLHGGHAPRYGYQYGPEENQHGKPTRERYVVHPEHAEVVQFIFEEIAKGTPKLRLCKELQAQGIPNPGSRPAGA